jgi:hypothetical protein
VPTAPGCGMTRHPRKGAAQQLWLLYRNHPEISSLQNLRRSGAPEVPIWELVENKARQLKGKKPLAACLAIPLTRKTFPPLSGGCHTLNPERGGTGGPDEMA